MVQNMGSPDLFIGTPTPVSGLSIPDNILHQETKTAQNTSVKLRQSLIQQNIIINYPSVSKGLWKDNR